MKLKVKLLEVEAGGKYIVLMNEEDIKTIGFSETGRVNLITENKSLACIYNISKSLPQGVIGVYKEVAKKLELKENQLIEVEYAPQPRSIEYIRKKIKGEKLNYQEVFEIVKDVISNKLTEIEISAFVTALSTKGIDLEEASYLTLAMVETGKKTEWPKNEIILDKHSIGGVPGDKTTLILVPIIASLGYKIPKSSSRAVTNVAGTADRAEALMPVNLTIEEVCEVVKKTNGCIVWGGTLDLAPADDIFIKIENPLKIDPLLLPSIMAKKKAMGSKYVVIDIPIGKDVKVKTIDEGERLGKKFIELGKKLGIKVSCVLTYGEQPIGYAIGPNLEAKEALEVLMRRKHVPDLIDKATDLAAKLLRMIGISNGKELSLNALNSGKAEEKIKEIIEAQGGNPKIKPEEIEVGNYKAEIVAEKDGFVILIRNTELIKIGRMLGAPKYKASGILIHKKLGEKVKKGEKLLTLYAEKLNKLERTLKYIQENKINPMMISEKIEMSLRIID